MQRDGSDHYPRPISCNHHRKTAGYAHWRLTERIHRVARALPNDAATPIGGTPWFLTSPPHRIHVLGGFFLASLDCFEVAATRDGNGYQHVGHGLRRLSWVIAS